jgi:hypothetical protein
MDKLTKILLAVFGVVLVGVVGLFFAMQKPGAPAGPAQPVSATAPGAVPGAVTAGASNPAPSSEAGASWLSPDQQKALADEEKLKSQSPTAPQ